MTSQTFFFECPSVLNIFFYNFLGHTTFNTSMVFYGAINGLDQNWDGVELLLNNYNIGLSLRSSVLLACISIWVIFGGIILLSDISNTTQYANISKEDIATKDKPSNRDIVDVRYYDYRVGERVMKFVYDRRDQTGARLRTLFDGKMYQEYTIGPRSGFLIGAANRTMGYTEPDTIKVPTLVPQVAIVEQSAVITSNSLPIEKIFNGQGSVNLKVLKNTTWI